MAEQIMQNAAGKTIPAGYQQTEVGVIPEDWSTPTINEITNNIIDYRGRTPKKLGMEWGGGNILALSAGNVKKGFIDYRAECYFGSDELYRKWMTSGHAQKDDIVFTMEAPLGNAALIPDEKRYILSQRTVLLQIAKSKINPKFIIQYFLSDLFQKYISDCATGSTAQGIKRATFEQMFVAVPLRLEEQTAIANVLSDSDALIDALEQLIAKKQAIKSATMQQLLTGRTRLPAFALRPDGTPKGYKPSELGDIPEDWEVKSVYALANNQKALFDDGDWIEAEHITDKGVRLIQTGNIGIGSFIEKDVKKYVYEKSFESLRCKELHIGDLLICRLAEPAGRACILPYIGEAKVITSVDVTIFRPERNIANRDFLVQYFSSTEWFKSVQEQVGGTTHKRISRGALGQLLMPYPSLDEQTAIATILSDMDNELQALTQKLEKAHALKQGMMQQLLTGKIRLPLAAGA
ncbi:restriction endonuclease subunit S [Aeromonas caviae]|uniref:restriction endonuclease subunit S n=1 Tax=Aeromonas caviae TaxID=648 RepID=UPI00244858DE|nr:restriction endonuclease subunit S [Aeromonas caviae]MDH0318833.1 restriction endonuclease subunit S [Aeromonas caviae]